MVKCISILGHKFRPRYDEIPPSALERIQSETEDGALRFVKAMTQKIYRGDVCVRCGISSGGALRHD